MYCNINAGGLRGLESYIAQVEVDVSNGLPGFDMVGLLANEVKEARERIRVALKNAGVRVPAEKITVNISPAGIHKGGTAFDLPVALGIMVSQGQFSQDVLNGVLVAGELGLNGEVKPIRGALPIVMRAAREGIRECILPFENLREAYLAGEASVMGVKNLTEAVAYLLSGKKEQKQLRASARKESAEQDSAKGGKEKDTPFDFIQVRGMLEAKRAAMTAAAGMHNLLLIGPPGAGKTMLAKCIPSILPPLEREEQLEISSIYSVAGLLQTGELADGRPFVSPHHTISPFALAGGGAVPRPGMVSLAHRGVLFLDELAEFKRSTLDILRQPMEEGKIYLAKSGGNFVYPSDFMLAAATNPCPCGYYPDRNRCHCTAYEVHRYLSRISGPLMDRIDIRAVMRPVPLPDLLGTGSGAAESGMDSRSMRTRVLEARLRQTRRYAGTRIGVNGRLGAGEVLKYCVLGTKEQIFMERAAERLRCSARACHRILRVARTLADLEGCDRIGCGHLSEALCLRKNEVSDREDV